MLAGQYGMEKWAALEKRELDENMGNDRLTD